jgi:N6-L-threonylcarbamoyladenine synthase
MERWRVLAIRPCRQKVEISRADNTDYERYKQYMSHTIVLAIETSCDETGVAVLARNGHNIEILANGLASQVDVHVLTGGVVPEIAAREHVAVMRPLVAQVMKESGCDPSAIDAVAVTVGPGLAPALSVGVAAAKALSFAWRKPIVPVQHLEGHLYSALLSGVKNSHTQFIIPDDIDIFPAVGLIVSGGHTMLVVMKEHLQYEIVGTTRDDAVGEAFDKVARMLDLPYPGGPPLSELAKSGDSSVIALPRPMANDGSFDFSFSGLKTAVYYVLEDMRKTDNEVSDEMKANVAASFEKAAVDTLVGKTIRLVDRINPKSLLLSGGVAANGSLRTALADAVKGLKVSLKIAPLFLCGDNAEMIGMVGVLGHEKGRKAKWESIDFDARLPLTAFSTGRRGWNRE